MKKKNLIKIVDVSKVIKLQKIYYNESLLNAEHDNPPFSYWPVDENTLKNIDNARYKTLLNVLND